MLRKKNPIPVKDINGEIGNLSIISRALESTNLYSAPDEDYANSRHSQDSQSADSFYVLSNDSDEGRDSKELEREKLWRERDREIDETGRIETIRHREVLSQAGRGGKWDKFHIHNILVSSTRNTEVGKDKIGHRDTQRERRDDRKASRATPFLYTTRERERDRREEEREQNQVDQLTRMIGYLTATASEDLSLVLEVCERISASDANAKAAIKALRREFKYAEPDAQLSAIRLWAIILHNSSSTFMNQSNTKKLLETVEDVLTSTRTTILVRERLLEVLAAAVFVSTSKGYSNGLRNLWRKVKEESQPDEGIPLSSDDFLIGRPSSDRYVHTRSYISAQDPELRSNAPEGDGVISYDEDLRRLLQECKIGRGNAALLSEALAFALPRDLADKDIIKEFYAKCRASQELIFAQIPWATAEAEKSRLTLSKSEQKKTSNMRLSTQEEILLAELLKTNEELNHSLRIYADIERVGIEDEAQSLVEERSLTDSPNIHVEDPHLLRDRIYLNSLSSSASIISSKSKILPQLHTSTVPNILIHPDVITPRVFDESNYRVSAGLDTSMELLKRSSDITVGQVYNSRTPSPAISSGSSVLHSRSHSSSSFYEDSVVRKVSSISHLRDPAISIETNKSDSDNEVQTPVEPSAKALGKRRMDEGRISLSEVNELSDEKRLDGPRSASIRNLNMGDTTQAPFSRYIYDAAAERTKQWINAEQKSSKIPITRIS